VKKTILFSIVSFILLILFSLFFIFYTLSFYTHTDILYFPSQLYRASNNPTLLPGFNFIILGLDPRNDQLEKTLTSDTIMVGRLNQNWQVNLVSIPRDLWIYSLNTKVNQIYPISQEKINWSESVSYIEGQFSQLTGQSITRTIVLTTNNLIKLTQLIGGVDITLVEDYVDQQYPNPDYISHPDSVTPIYKTVIFKKGTNHIDETNVTEFVRSRKGQNSDGSGGTDIGRIYRQQLLADSILAKLKDISRLKNPSYLIALYNFWHTQLKTNITDQDIIGLLFRGSNQINNLKLNKTSIPTAEYPQKDIIYHPPTFPNKQWVYIPQDKEYSQLKSFISDFLHQ